MRIDKYVSFALGKTRSEARTIIKKGLIKENDKIINKFDYYIDDYANNIYYNDKILLFKEFVYIMLYKPQGVVSATQDNLYPTVIDLVKNEYPKKDLVPVGRLDVDTTGLIILTNDGKLTHVITSPKHNWVKKYYVVVDGNFIDEDIINFKEGLEITDSEGKTYITKESKLEIVDTNKAYISISEGKYHQVKRMCLKLGKKVTFLKRVSIGNIILDESLKEGEYRELTNDEINVLKGNKSDE